MSDAAPVTSREVAAEVIKTCRAVLDGSRCVRERSHPYSDWASNPKKLHRTKDDVLFTGGIKTRAQIHKVLGGNAEHFSEADYQTWMRLP